MRKEIMSAHLPIRATCELSGPAGTGSLKHGVAEIGLGTCQDDELPVHDGMGEI